MPCHQPEKTTSPYIIVKASKIHNKGVYAKTSIPAGTKIIEYVGEKISKAEAQRRAEIPLGRHKKNQKNGAVYIFDLNKKQDLDGDVPYNTARFINHACEPNCEAENVRGHVWIISIKDIQPGEELTYNYGYYFDEYEDHRCNCGSEGCVGYILDKKYWPRLKRRQKREQGMASLPG